MSDKESLLSRVDVNRYVKIIGCLGYMQFSFLAIRLFLRYVVFQESPLDLPPGLSWIGPDNSIVLWGTIWGITGVMGFVGGINLLRNKSPKFFFMSIILFISLHIVWASAYFVGWLFLNGDWIGWMGGSTYSAPIGLLIAFYVGALNKNRQGELIFT